MRPEVNLHVVHEGLTQELNQNCVEPVEYRCDPITVHVKTKISGYEQEATLGGRGFLEFWIAIFFM